MPGATCPCTKIRSAPCSASGPCHKWLKPTSYRVAEDWNDAMWPPSSELSLLALSTVATAFHRVSERMVCSTSRSPGYSGCSSTGIVLMYGVLAENGTWTAWRRAASWSCWSRKAARSTPSNSTTESSASRHSWVSRGSWSSGICAPCTTFAGGRRARSSVAPHEAFCRHDGRHPVPPVEDRTCRSGGRRAGTVRCAAPQAARPIACEQRLGRSAAGYPPSGPANQSGDPGGRFAQPLAPQRLRPLNRPPHRDLMCAVPDQPRQPADAPWWRSAVIYQIYPRSFADSDGDGIGDLPGIRSRLPYLRDLGVDAVWLSPFYPSPQADAGYDVADHRAVDPRFGTLADADALIGEAHQLGLRVIVDLVPNHTSSEHPWFQEALAAAPGSAARARYLFRDGTGPDGSGPPNNWMSNFGGRAWTRVPGPDGAGGPGGQRYLHLFTP